jgi:hypothetical protein
VLVASTRFMLVTILVIHFHIDHGKATRVTRHSFVECGESMIVV